jgi:tripartite-type tricarboxylate transporter receptor subunit TctC
MGAKMIVLPAGTPEDIVDTYRTAMAKALSSEEIKSGAAAQKVLGGYPQSLGKQSEKILQEAAVLKPEDFNALKKWPKVTYNVE